MASTTLLTSEQFLALPEELDPQGNSVSQELITGEVVSMPPPSQQHDIIRSNILQALFGYVLTNLGLGLKVLPDAAFVVSVNSILVPDAAVVAIGRLSPRNHKYFPGAPELAIEVVSPTETAIHLKNKVDAYLANGSQSVWIAYPDARSVMVHRIDSVRELRGGQELQDALLPGFSVPVAAFFELT